MLERGRSRLTTLIVLLGMMFALLGSAAYAQTTSATLSGTVVDQSNATVMGGKVSITNPQTGLHRVVTTNGEGFFSFPALMPGKYSLTVQHAGFSPVQVNNIELNVNDQRIIRVQLRIGTQQESVNVTDQVTPVEQAPGTSTVVNRQFVENLPMNGRSFQSLLALTPGVVMTAATGADQSQFSVNGQRSYSNYFTVDGTGANVGMSWQPGYAPSFAGTSPGLTAQGTTQGLVSIDALEEFKIQTSNYSPEFGRAAGGQVQFVTRSGTNTFHGLAYEYLRNDAFDANDWFNNNANKPKPPMRQNDFGGTFGGPVLLPGYNGRNRTFFFFSYESLRLRLPNTGSYKVPSLALRNSAPAALRPLLNAYPIPTGPETLDTNGVGTGLAPWNASYSDPSSLDSLSLRVDHAFNSRFSLFGRYARSQSDSARRTLNSVMHASNNGDALTVGSMMLFTTSLLNDLRFNWSRNVGEGTNVLDSFGGAVVPPDSALLPSFATTKDSSFTFGLFGGIQGYQAGPFAVNQQRQLNLVDSISWTRGAHSMKFGLDYRRLYPILGPRKYQLSLFFFTLGALNASSPFTSVLSQASDIQPVFNNYAVFAVDNWRLSQRLVLTYGLRWEVNPSPKNANGPLPVMLTGLDDPGTIALAPPDTPIYPTRYNNIAPRIGVSYQVSNRAGHELVVRGGIGMFHDVSGVQATSGFTTYPFVASKMVFGTYPLTEAQLAPPTYVLTPPYTGTYFTVYDSHFNAPYTCQWNATVEQALGTNQSITASYVGNFGRRLIQREYRSQPNANFKGTVYILRPKATSDYSSLQLEFQRRLSRGLQALVSYTWSHVIDDTSYDLVSNAPSRASADFDVRHNFKSSITYDIPAPKWGRVASRILAGWGTDLILSAQSGMPLTLSASQTNIGSEVVTQRPNVVPGVPWYISDSNAPGGRRINIAAFSEPLPATQGNVGRNALRALTVAQADLALRRSFKLSERLNLQFRAEAFNFTNHPNFGAIDTNFYSGNKTFGVPTMMLGRAMGGMSPLYQVGGPRSMQVSLRLAF